MNYLQIYSWVFLAGYVGLMMFCGAVGLRRVRGGDDFATARGGYGPIFLSLAMTATAASGATFLGIPGLSYEYGVSALWYAFVYPMAVYTGVLICLSSINRLGDEFGSRSIPEYLGDRYQSDFLRIALSLFSLMLLFYLAGQLIAGTVMFEQMLGLSAGKAMVITAGVLTAYIVLGGAHADILTDGVQGALMISLSLGVALLFLTGYGIDGGLPAVWSRLNELDPQTTACFHPDNPLVASWWDVFCVFVAHVPLGLLPHLGNKLWALKDRQSRMKFVGLSFVFGMILPSISLGGIMARAHLGDQLFDAGQNPSQAIPALFIYLFPTWVAALLGTGVLAAIMSTADGLVISCSQVFANDLYRRTWAPRFEAYLTEEQVDHRALVISRWATVAVLGGSLLLAWNLLDVNVALVVWIGLGGMMAALAGSLILGVIWPGVTRHGAICGAFVGAATFILLKLEVIPPAGGVLTWLNDQGANSFACATLGIATSVLSTFLVSLMTEPLDAALLDRIAESKKADDA